MRQIHHWLGDCLRDASGNILPMAAVGMLVAVVVVGAAVDISRTYKVQNQLQAACDAAVLAGRRSVTTNGLDEASKAIARNYFATNFNDGVHESTGTTFDSTSDDDGQTVKGTASTTVNTLIMRLVGYDTFPVNVHCTSSMGVGNADVMMVLDTTGSMGEALGSSTRIAALRSAVKNFYKTLSTATNDTNARVRYGFVPYSSTVNVGHLLSELNPAFLANSADYQSRQPVFYNVSKGTKGTSTVEYKNAGSSNTSKSYNSSSACNSALSANDTDYKDYGSATSTTSTSGTSPNVVVNVVTTQPQRKMEYSCAKSGSKYYLYTYTYTRDKVTTQPYTNATTNAPTSGYTFDHFQYMKLTRDTSLFKTFAATAVNNGTNGASVSYTWGGCIIERQTVNSDKFSYSSITGMSPSGALDVDIDTAPGTGNATRWAPLWPEISYRRAGSAANTYTLDPGTTGASAGTYCPAKSQLLQEMDQKSFNAYADSLTAVGGTYLDIGMIWGGRLLSPDGIFGSVVNKDPSNGGEVSRHIIFMTDGYMDTANYVPTAWGMEWWDRRTTSDGSKLQEDARHTQRFLSVCEAIKAKGIRVWVIAFTSALSTDLQTCASDDSSFTANNSTELDSAFQEIAKQVGELRITQ